MKKEGRKGDRVTVLGRCVEDFTTEDSERVRDGVWLTQN